MFSVFDPSKCTHIWSSGHTHTHKIFGKSVAIWKISGKKITEFAINSSIAESWRDCQTLTEQSRFRETTHFSISLCLTAAAHASLNIHTRTGISGPQPNRGGVRPSLSLIGLDHDMSLTCQLLNSRETL